MNDFYILCFTDTSNFDQQNFDVTRQAFYPYWIDRQIANHSFCIYLKNLFLLRRFETMTSSDLAEDILEELDTNRDGRYE